MNYNKNHVKVGETKVSVSRNESLGSFRFINYTGLVSGIKDDLLAVDLKEHKDSVGLDTYIISYLDIISMRYDINNNLLYIHYSY